MLLDEIKPLENQVKQARSDIKEKQAHIESLSQALSSSKAEI